MCFIFYWCLFSNLLLWRNFWNFIYDIIYCVGAGKTTLISTSYRIDPYFFRRNMETTRSLKEEMDGELFISRQFLSTLNKGTWTALHWHHLNIWTIWTKRINDPSQHNHLFIHIAAEPIQNWHTDPTKLANVPAPNEHPNVLAPLLKLYAAIAMCVCPTGDFAQNARIHAIRDDWRKAKQQCTTRMITYNMAQERH